MTHDLLTPSDPEIVPQEWLLERMRILRNRLLAQSDWTQLADAPCDRAAWATYRQQLRDLPATWQPGPTVDIPAEPS